MTELNKTYPAIICTAITNNDGALLRTTPEKLRIISLLVRSSTYLQLRTLADIAVLDKLLPFGRFVINYLFLSSLTGQRLTIQVYANETSTIPSLAVPFANGQRLFASAN